MVGRPCGRGPQGGFFSVLAYLSATDAVIPFLAGKGKATDYCRTPVSMGCQLRWNISRNAGVTRTYSEWLDGDSVITLLLKIVLCVTIALLLRRIVNRTITRITLRMAEGTMSEKIRERTRTIFDGS